MDLYQNLDNSDESINYFCDILEELISKKVNYNVKIWFKKHDLSIFFSIDVSSILEIYPDRLYSHSVVIHGEYQDEILKSISRYKTQYKRDIKIEDIINK